MTIVADRNTQNTIKKHTVNLLDRTETLHMESYESLVQHTYSLLHQRHSIAFSGSGNVRPFFDDLKAQFETLVKQSIPARDLAKIRFHHILIDEKTQIQQVCSCFTSRTINFLSLSGCFRTCGAFLLCGIIYSIIAYTSTFIPFAHRSDKKSHLLGSHVEAGTDDAGPKRR